MTLPPGRLTLLVPVTLTATAAPEMVLPLASRAVTVTVAALPPALAVIGEPLTRSDELPALTVPAPIVIVPETTPARPPAPKASVAWLPAEPLSVRLANVATPEPLVTALVVPESVALPDWTCAVTVTPAWATGLLAASSS